MVFNNPNSKILNQIFWFGIFGLVVYALGLFGYISLFSLLPPFLALLYLVRPSFGLKYSFSTTEKLLLALIAIQLVIYSLGLFIPETAFDALWYHFPEALNYATTGQISALPGLPLYSTMPRLGEMYFTAGFVFAGQFGAKLASFIFTLIFLAISYRLGRRHLSRPLSLLLIATINSMFVIAWQSTSGYVDIMAAVFQLASLLALFSAGLPLAAVFAGFALSVKIQSFVFLLAVAPAILSRKYLTTSIIRYSLFILLALAIASPWYLDNYLSTGSPAYPLNVPELRQNMLLHSGVSSQKEWIIRQVTSIYRLPFHLSLHPDLQLTPVILLLLPLVILNSKTFTNNRPLRSLIFYSLFFILLWWFLPPPEHRYALGAIPPLLIILYSHLGRFRRPAIIFSLIFILLNLSVRIYISRRYLPVIFGTQTKTEYLNSQTTDFNRDIIKNYYGKP